MMEDEVEDIVGDVQYTDSQKSVTTLGTYSQDFTDSSPERNDSSGKQTYVLDRDDSDDSGSTFRVNREQSVINLYEAMSPPPDMQQLLYDEINKSIRSNFKRHTFTHEFTQTSKTIIELAQTEVIVVTKPKQTNSLETQTSFVSLTEHKTMDYKRIIVNDCIPNKNEVIHNVIEDMNHIKKLFLNQNPDTYVKNLIVTEVQSSHNDTNEQILAVENLVQAYEDKDLGNKTGIHSEHSFEDRIIPFIDDESKDSGDQKEANETNSEFESSKYDSDIDEDSLMETEYRSSRRINGDNASDTSEMQISIDNDVDELYNKLSESPLWRSPEVNIEPCALKFGTLTPLSEETSLQKSCLDKTTSSQTLMEPTKDTDNETVFVHNDGVKVKIFSNSGDVRATEKFKLPPIPNTSCPNSPHLNFLFTINTNPMPLVKAGTLPHLFEGRKKDSWQNCGTVLASGESPLITGRSDPVKTPRESMYLPPIHMEGAIYHNTNKPTHFVTPHQTIPSPETTQDAISIQGKIRELKAMTNNKTRSSSENRNRSPASSSSRPEKLYEVAERGCDNLCVELLRRLRSPSWIEVVETLEDLPRSLEKYWTVVTLHRIAELLRQVTVHIDSPRTQVARSACNALAEILKNTNYTRKPDFYESVSALLCKTGSFSRPVRRAANVALDDIACGVDATHAATAVCVYGVGHKSALVRCASARLLVVCCALAEGGRRILRARPPSAAAARRLVLRALAQLLQDKNIDTRKYAERLYTILRPLPTFEAYFLTDVDVELAARQMKKYDPMLVPSKRDSATSLSIFS
ncbi:uncharacterized protein LOC120626872 isoform X2 [Pararge aegeria]|uniref:uncharacterized protein LOC120626872 isoform X2 n=1 Tax=Pararge aegeria TaxID=116150 RepID=UPI0019D02DAC|nr:uncharacterized protein LOC120626872 isoform X2 [Pararge aegeria]